MAGLSGSELLFYGGIMIMAFAVAAGIVCAVIFHITGLKMKYQLDEEYGKPLH